MPSFYLSETLPGDLESRLGLARAICGLQIPADVGALLRKQDDVNEQTKAFVQNFCGAKTYLQVFVRCYSR